MKFKHLFASLALAFLLCAVFSQTAHAYMDPGTGSYIFQIVIAGILGGFFVVRRGRAKIVDFYSRIFRAGKKK